MSRRIIRLVIRARNLSTWFSHELQVGVNWRWNLLRFFGFSHRCTSALLCVQWLSIMRCTSCSSGSCGSKWFEPYKFPAAMAILTSAADLTIVDIEHGELSRWAVAFVIVRLALRQARSFRKDRCGAVPGLNLTYLFFKCGSLDT